MFFDDKLLIIRRILFDCYLTEIMLELINE